MSGRVIRLIDENKKAKAKTLDLGNCELTKLPKELEECIWLESLILQGNTKLSDLSPLSNLTNLRALYCYSTLIADLSPLAELVNMEVLLCFNTQVSDLYPLIRLINLQAIDCRRTMVANLWPVLPLIKIGKQVNLSETGESGDIRVAGCPLTTPPIEIVRQGNSAIVQYFEELDRAKISGTVIRLAEAKCLILGEGGAGKTSLARKLLNPTSQLPEEKATTKGVDVFPYDLKLSDGTDFRLNIWDFGGQEIYHATHQFFLTKRSLYILLDDTRKDEKTVNDPTFNYWLQVAQLYGGGSPLIIVQNEKGDRSKQLDLPGMQGRFGFVKESKSVNLLSCRGLDKVWEAIEFWLKQLPHIGEEQPKAWLDIRRELERVAREEGRDHITLENFYQICAKNTIPEKERALFLSSYLHDFGAFLHFQDHPVLRKTLVLNNQWATDAVYKVLDCEEVKGALGRFTRADLTTIWAEVRYADQHEELLALMEKFELCYKLPDEKTEIWLAPQLLSVLQPDELDWVDTDNLQIRYEYEFMPKGLLSQHIVRMHRYVLQPELAWKSGVVFERERSQALVTEAWGSRKISLRARGVHAKELLTLLSEDFDTMHMRLEGLKVKKMIPCNCRVCIKSVEPHFYDYDDLALRKSTGKRTVECKIPPYEDVSVAGLLDGVFVNLPLDGEVINSNLRFATSNRDPLKVFISYSKHDHQHKDTLLKHLSGLRGKVVAWHDHDIFPGEDWDERIKAALCEADVVLYLVTHNSLATDYIQRVELPIIEQRCAVGDCILVPVIVDFCLWTELDFAKRNALPEKDVSITDKKWANENEAWVKVVEGVRRILER
ncbi:MAG: TIR domain-containing protein [Phycisphaerae bacterium]|nr:TIR domain-containing protein [Saprospiraceae bacterium]